VLIVGGGWEGEGLLRLIICERFHLYDGAFGQRRKIVSFLSYDLGSWLRFINEDYRVERAYSVAFLFRRDLLRMRDVHQRGLWVYIFRTCQVILCRFECNVCL
jgi:hypothetical protein